MAMKCSQCGAVLAPGEVFCGECGRPVQGSAPVGRTCPQCRTALAAGERFCSSCGHDVSAATVSPPAAPTVSSVSPISTPPPLTVAAATNQSRTVLILGLVTVAAIFLLGVVGLWLWLGGGRPATTNQRNANTPKTNANIAGVWNCLYLPEASEAEAAQMNLTQNGSAITGTMVASVNDTTSLAGTFDGQFLSITSPKVMMPLTLTPDGLTMTGGAVEEGMKVSVVCRR